MSKTVLVVLIIVLCGAAVAYDNFHIPSSTDRAVHTENTGKPARTAAPDFTFSARDGSSLKLSDFKGRKIMLNFWATWCVPCIREFPLLIDYAAKHQNDIVLIALSVDDPVDGKPVPLDKFFAKFPAEMQADMKSPNIIIGYDPDKHISRDLFQVFRYPETYIISPDLYVDDKYVGSFPDTQ